MTVTIQLPADIGAELAAQAAARGSEQAPIRGNSGLSPSERAAAWLESSKDLPRTAPLSDEAIGRESIYRDRDSG
jgi:hypothetical protein